MSCQLIIQVLTSQMTRTASSAALLNPKNLPFDESTDEREFAKGIFKIDENCVIACLLPCVVYSSVNSRWNSLNEKNERELSSSLFQTFSLSYCAQHIYLLHLTRTAIQDPEIVGEDCGIFWLFACCGLSVFLSVGTSPPRPISHLFLSSLTNEIDTSTSGCQKKISYCWFSRDGRCTLMLLSSLLPFTIIKRNWKRRNCVQIGTTSSVIFFFFVQLPVFFFPSSLCISHLQSVIVLSSSSPAL
jgi:hypothetical protein